VLLDLNFTKLIVLGLVALIVFGPERLPTIAAQAGRALREVRKMLDGAKSELRDNLGPEFSDFDIADLNPRHLVRKHLMDEVTGDGVLVNAFNDVRNAATGTVGGGNGAGGGVAGGRPALSLPSGERPPFDTEAT
jgi:sec-independent protein translocase protein TatB